MEKTQVKFQRTLELLRDPEASFTAEAIYSLSDLDREQLAAFRHLWSDLPTERRESLILRLVETAETNFDLDFSSIIYTALDDPDAGVRKAAVEGVLEDSPTSVIERLLVMAQDDPFNEVRAAALQALGMFILAGEFGRLPESLNTRMQDTVLALHMNPNEDLEVRRRALEAISNCGHEGVLDLIRAAYYAPELPMRVSAVFAMGRSCDDIWAPQILEELSSDHPELRYEAARAAGELELRKALPRLIELAYEDDREIQQMAIWSLGEIGGKTAENALERLAKIAEENEDDDLAEAIEEARDAAQMAGDGMLPLFDLSDYYNDEEDDEFNEELEELERSFYYEDLELDEDEDEDDYDDHADESEDDRFSF